MSVDKKKAILYAVLVVWFGNLIWIGKSYLGSFWGNTIFISSSLFLVTFFILNHCKVEDIKEKKLISDVKNIDILLMLYFVIIMALNIVGSLKPPSIFLYSLFFIYLVLTIMWILVFENKMLTKYSGLLLLLALFPLIIGLISSEMENNIENSIKNLNPQIVYYEDNLDNITNGILTKNYAGNIRYTIQYLKSDLESAKKDYLSGDLISSEKKLKDAEEISHKLKNYFDLLDTKTALFDMLRTRDKTINWLYSEARSHDCGEIENEQILRDINLTETKLDLSWNKYREGDFQISYDLIKEIDNEIIDINKRFERCVHRPVPAPQFMLILIVFVLAKILIHYNRSRRK